MSLQGQTGLWGGVGGGILGGKEPPPLYDWTTATFTPSGAYGTLGPTQAQFDSEQSGKPFLTDYSKVINSIQYVRIPKTADYQITLYGAYGGPSDPWDGNTTCVGGVPWYLSTTTEIAHGTWLGIIVGQKGAYGNATTSNGGGGGGGSYVFNLNSTVETAPALTAPHVYTCTPTAIAVAAGGNGANWAGWQVPAVNARSTTTSASDWAASIPQGYGNFGRGAMGSSFEYTPYWWVAPGITWYTYFQSSKLKASGAPIKTSGGVMHSHSGFGGFCIETNAMSDGDYSRTTLTGSCGEGGSGGFGGGGGSTYEGAGGGGYWGGAANKTNDYTTSYSYGGQSYVAPGSNTSGSSLASSVVSVPSTARGSKQTYPWNANLDGKITITQV
tara:strand:+ start:563 stop:1717 length:1155 start_codon:yes stop_codon:yes gene_type:complete